MSIAEIPVRRAVWVLLGWFVVVLAVNLLVPQLESVVADDSTPVVPTDTASLEAFAAMDDAFGNGRTASVLFVVVERDGGLEPADRRYLRGLVPRMLADDHVSNVSDIRRHPDLLTALTSRDGEAAYLQVGIAGSTGAPSSIRQIEAVREIVRDDLPNGLEVAVTGPPATIADMSTEVERSLVRVTAVTIGVIAVILLVMYRSIVVTMLVLGFIGFALAAARGITSLAGLHVFNVSTFTGAFLTGVTLGAATDYAIFLISRYHEQRRLGLEPRAAIVLATRRVGAVILGSALTVIVASASMLLAELGLFSTTGPAIATSVAVTLALSLTVLPALIMLLASRGLLEPRPVRFGGWWERVSRFVVARPARVLVAGLVPLLLLAGFYPALEPSFDERSGQPESTESNRGYDLVARHYPDNEVLADFVLITADHDLRNSRDLAALEQAAASATRVPGVALVRSVTRPLGRPIARASLGHQMGEVGDRLRDASGRLAEGAAPAQRLAEGAGQLTTGVLSLADGADRAASGAGSLVAGARSLHGGLSRLADGSESAIGGSRRLQDGAQALADGLELAYEQTRLAVDGLGLAYDALLHRSLTCDLDPACRRARDGIRQVYEGERDRLLPGLRQAASAAQRIADGTLELQKGLARLEAGLDRAERGAASLTSGQQDLRAGIGRLAVGTDRVAEGSRRVEDGTARMTESVGSLHTGLDRAATYLGSTARTAQEPAIGGFYLPPRALGNARFSQATSAFLSPDGRTARMLVLGSDDSFSREAIRRATDVRRAVAEGLRGTRLEGSRVETTGLAAINGELERLSERDFGLVALVALTAVFLILLLVLRSLVVATMLLASVVLSYAAAMGLAVLVWQVWLDLPLEWTVPTIAFVLLVAVGADYNLLLMKRVREEAPDGSPDGIARAAAATGGVITAAGVIFAGSMFAMLSGSVTPLMQMGFTIGAGLLLDTFVVRTLVVPASATLLGPLLWPRSRRGARRSSLVNQ